MRLTLNYISELHQARPVPPPPPPHTHTPTSTLHTADTHTKSHKKVKNKFCFIIKQFAVKNYDCFIFSLLWLQLLITFCVASIYYVFGWSEILNACACSSGRDDTLINVWDLLRAAESRAFPSRMSSLIALLVLSSSFSWARNFSRNSGLSR